MSGGLCLGRCEGLTSERVGGAMVSIAAFVQFPANASVFRGSLFWVANRNQVLGDMALSAPEASFW